jgi:hypothetical protein
VFRNGIPFIRFGIGFYQHLLRRFSFEKAGEGEVLMVSRNDSTRASSGWKWAHVLMLSALTATSISGLMACGSNLAFLAERSRTEAQALQEDCHAAGLSSGYVALADTLVLQANQHWKEGDPLPAQQKSERAAAFYRLAMAESEAIGAKAAVDSLYVARLKKRRGSTPTKNF